MPGTELRFENGTPVDADGDAVRCEHCDDRMTRPFAVVTPEGAFCSVACAANRRDA